MPFEGELLLMIHPHNQGKSFFLQTHLSLMLRVKIIHCVTLNQPKMALQNQLMTKLVNGLVNRIEENKLNQYRSLLIKIACAWCYFYWPWESPVQAQRGPQLPLLLTQGVLKQRDGTVGHGGAGHRGSQRWTTCGLYHLGDKHKHTHEEKKNKAWLHDLCHLGVSAWTNQAHPFAPAGWDGRKPLSVYLFSHMMLCKIDCKHWPLSCSLNLGYFHWETMSLCAAFQRKS